MKTISYLRVSTPLQNLEKDKKDILFYAHNNGMKEVVFYEETISGKIHWRKRKLGEVINSLIKNDNLILPEISRLGRSSLEIFEILSILLERKVNVYSLKEKWQLNETLQSKIYITVLSLCSEIERSLISQRTSVALQALKSSGIKLGRPKGKGKSKLDQHKTEIHNLLANGSTKRFIANKFGVSEVGLYNWLKSACQQI